jgi:hypothetical protein
MQTGLPLGQFPTGTGAHAVIIKPRTAAMTSQGMHQKWLMRSKMRVIGTGSSAKGR